MKKIENWERAEEEGKLMGKGHVDQKKGRKDTVCMGRGGGGEGYS